MKKIQKMGGVASIISGIAYLVGIAIAVTIVMPSLSLEVDETIVFMTENATMLFIWHLFIYIIAGVALVFIAIAVYDRLKVKASAMAQLSLAFGIIWATLVLASGMMLILDANVVTELYKNNVDQAIQTYITLTAVENALGGGIELPGGVWIILLSLGGLSSKIWPKALNILGLIIGVAGIVTVAPALHEVGMIFGLGFIIWFIWMGIVMIKSEKVE